MNHRTFSPINVIPAKADASEATDEVNPGSTTFRTNYPLAWARPSSTTCPPWQYRAHSRFHVLPEQNPPSKGDSLATRPAEQGRGMSAAVKDTGMLEARTSPVRSPGERPPPSKGDFAAGQHTGFKKRRPRLTVFALTRSVPPHPLPRTGRVPDRSESPLP